MKLQLLSTIALFVISATTDEVFAQSSSEAPSEAPEPQAVETSSIDIDLQDEATEAPTVTVAPTTTAQPTRTFEPTYSPTVTDAPTTTFQPTRTFEPTDLPTTAEPISPPTPAPFDADAVCIVPDRDLESCGCECQYNGSPNEGKDHGYFCMEELGGGEGVDVTLQLCCDSSITRKFDYENGSLIYMCDRKPEWDRNFPDANAVTPVDPDPVTDPVTDPATDPTPVTPDTTEAPEPPPATETNASENQDSSDAIANSKLGGGSLMAILLVGTAINVV